MSRLACPPTSAQPPAAPRSGRRRARGLSLIEFLVAIALLAVTLAFGAPSLQGFFERNRLVGAAEAVYAEARLARPEALRRSGNVILTLVPGAAWCAGHSAERPTAGPGSAPAPCDCRLTDPLDPDACAVSADGDALLRAVDGALFPAIQMASDVPAMIRFTGVRGTATPDASIALTAGSGEALRVDISRTGNVRLCAPGTPFRGYPAC